MAVGRRHRPQHPWQPQRHRAQRRPAGHAVDDGAARLREAEPDAPVQAAHQVVGVAGQVVQQHTRLRRGLRHVQRHVQRIRGSGDGPDAVLAGLVDEQRLPVLRQRDAVGEAQAARHHARAAGGGVVFDDAAGGALLEDVEHAGLEGAAPLRRRETRRGVGEVDLAVGRHHHRVGIADGVAADAVGQHRGGLAVGADGQQALEGIGGDQPAGGVEVEAEHAAAGVGEHLLAAAVGLHAQDPAAGHGRVQQAVAAQHDVLGAFFAAERDAAQPRKPRVDRVHAGVAGRGRRHPGHRLHRHRPQRQVGRERQQRQDQGEQQLLHRRAHLSAPSRRAGPAPPGRRRGR